MCPLCNSESAERLGILGNKVWYRCQGCGIKFSESLVCEDCRADHPREREALDTLWDEYTTRVLCQSCWDDSHHIDPTDEVPVWNYVRVIHVED